MPPSYEAHVQSMFLQFQMNDGKDCEIRGEVLQPKAHKEHHTFDEIGAQNRNSIGKAAIAKRETYKGGSNGVTINAPNPPFGYRFHYVSDVREVQDQDVNEFKNADARICQLSSQEVVEICAGASVDTVARNNDIKLVNQAEVSEEKVYEFAVTDGPTNTTQCSSVITPACLCSTSPPIYLRGNSSGNNIDVYISYRDKFVNHLVRRANYSFSFEMVAYAKPTTVPVKPYNAKVRICQLKRDEKDELCNLMLSEPYPKNYEIRRVEGLGPPLFEERMYQIKLGDFEYLFEPPLFLPACMCPTRPATFLRSKYVGGPQKVYVVIRDELDSFEARGCVERN